MASINFFYEQVDFKLSQARKHKNWISNAVSSENKDLYEINFIFCSDDYLYQINKSFLDHDTLTDVITFDHSEKDEDLIGDVYISIDRIRENAETYRATFENELKRVMIHGVLHLLGYRDKDISDSNKMRQKENFYLALFH